MDEKINILEILTQNLGKPQIDSAAWHTPEYCKAEEKVLHCENELEFYMGKDAQLRFAEYTSAVSAANDILVEVAYQQGMKDLAEFFCSLIDFKALLSNAEEKDKV